MKKLFLILISIFISFVLVSGCSNKIVKSNGKTTLKTISTKNPIINDKGATFIYRGKLQPKKHIFLTGGFNGWTPDDESMELKKGIDGFWKITIKIDLGQYEYKFVIDGKLYPDYNSKILKPDGTGDSKSLVIIK